MVLSGPLPASAAGWARLEHPNVVRVLEAGEDAGGSFLVLEALGNARTLADLLASGTRLGTGAALTLARQAAAALDHAHERGVVHGGLEPANLWVIGEPGVTPLTLKITGFGRTGGPSYAAPERRLGATPDARGDVYSLAVCVYEMLFATPMIPPLDQLATPFARALAEKPAHRPPTARAFVDDLQHWLDRPSAVVLQEPAAPRPAPSPPRPAPTRASPPAAATPAPGASGGGVLGGVADAIGAVGAGIGAAATAVVRAVRGATRRTPDTRAAPTAAAPSPPARADEARDFPGNPAHDPVDAAVFAPPAASAGETVLVQVFVHMPEQAAQVRTHARAADPRATSRATRSLGTRVRRGARIGFDLRAPGLAVDEPVQSLAWTGRPDSVAFGVTVPAGHAAGSVLLTVTMAVDSIPAGHVKFMLPVERGALSCRGEPRQVADEVKRYALAFVSYASADRDKVLARVQMLESLKIRYFQDLLSLDPGDRWERQLYKHIDECDLFLLFWSAAAKQSEWVMKEVRYALARKAGDELAPPEIKPVPIEGPPPVLPPAELAHLHFNDRIIYFIARPS